VHPNGRIVCQNKTIDRKGRWIPMGKMVSHIRANLPPGVDGWGLSLKVTMATVVGFGFVIMAVHA
jgi:hypothetical protein